MRKYVPESGEIDSCLYDYLEKEFYYSNIKKYRKYFKEWVNNLTKDQILGFEKQRIAVINKSYVK